MASKKPQKPGIHVNLMLAPELHAKIQARANRQASTVSNVIRIMILESFERQTEQSLESIRQDMEIVWARFSARFIRLELEEQLVDALASAQSLEDLTRIKSLARASQGLRTTGEQREERRLKQTTTVS